MPDENLEETYVKTTQEYLQAEITVFDFLPYTRTIGTHLASLKSRIRAYVDGIMPFDSPHGEEVRKAYKERVAIYLKDEAEKHRKLSLTSSGKMPTDKQSKNGLLSKTLLDIATEMFKEA